MYFKLAINNVKKSFKDYTIYFLTLTFAVCIFYTFNSMSAQTNLPGMDKTIAAMITAIVGTMAYLSVFVSIVLGLLIIYANNFLIKRRKKELGLYMSLGMGKNKISKLLVIEELIIGSLSLITGLLLGLIASQGLVLVTARFFKLSLKGLNFIIAPEAIIKTIIYFGIIYILVIIFNIVVISKYKLIDLLNAHKKNEKINFKNPISAGIIFIASLVMIVTAYYLVNKVGINPKSVEFAISIVLGIIGTATFFYGLTTFFIIVIQKNKKIYLNRLNIFTLRQINNKINTNFISMTVICLMLFITILMISVGVGMRKQNSDILSPFDATVNMYPGKDNNITLEKILEKNDVKIENGDKSAYVTEYAMNDDIGTVLSGYNISSGIFGSSESKKITATSISDFNRVREIQGKEKINLHKDSLLIQSNSSALKGVLEDFMSDNKTIKLDGREYNIQNKKIITDTNANADVANIDFTVIVQDEVVKSLKPYMYYLNINYGDSNKGSSEEAYFKTFELNTLANGSKTFTHGELVKFKSKVVSQEEMKYTTTAMLYVTLYLGVIFLISSAAVLALQQLSEASDSAERYNSLRKIGVSEDMINKSILMQTLIYFMLPLGLALVHTVVGLFQVNNFVESFGIASILKPALMTMGAMVIMYGIYFIATYFGYKNIVKKF
ncbi:MAG: FtsX-like permease family protein [Clostridium sp.]